MDVPLLGRHGCTARRVDLGAAPILTGGSGRNDSQVGRLGGPLGRYRSERGIGSTGDRYLVTSRKAAQVRRFAEELSCAVRSAVAASAPDLSARWKALMSRVVLSSSTAHRLPTTLCAPAARNASASPSRR